jgi:hypothetical protein
MAATAELVKFRYLPEPNHYTYLAHPKTGADRQYCLTCDVLDLYSESAGYVELVYSTFSSICACEYWNSVFKWATTGCFVF